MAIRRYAIETIEADQEQFTEFTEADIENLEFAPEELEALEAESTESINLEDVNPESVAESLESWMEGEEAYGYEAIANTPPSQSRTGNISSSLSKTANTQSLKTFTMIVKTLVKKIMSNPKARAKLQVAVRTGPTAIAELLTPGVANVVPKYFHWMIPLYLPPVTLALFDPIRQQVGVKPEEVEEAPEVFPFIPLIFGGISTLFSAGTYKNSKKKK